MKIELSKGMKIALFSAVAVVALGVGLFLECCDKKEFVVTSIPAPEDPINTEQEFNSHYTEDGKLDINTATVEEFDELNGIGEKLAQRIIDYREVNGPFYAVEELTLVKGIGDSLVQSIHNKICVR